MTFLRLEDAHILQCVGFNKNVNQKNKFRIQLEKDGELAVYTTGLFATKAFWFKFHALEVRVGTGSMQKGGGFVGGGFGLIGAAVGMAGAVALNALTARQKEYALLVVCANLSDGSQKHIVFGFPQLDESALRRKLSEGMSEWANDYVNHYLTLVDRLSDPSRLSASFQEIDNMLSRYLLSPEQHARLESALVARGGKRPIQNSTDVSPTDRIAQLNSLAALRASGALTEREFQQEKSRIMNSAA